MTVHTWEAVSARGPFEDGVTARLDAPHVGTFEPAVSTGDSVTAGRVVGRLVVLGRRHKVVAPAGAGGQVLSMAAAGPVQYGDALLSLGAATAVDGAAAEEDAAASEDGYPVCTPIDGIFYARPTPDAPAYVQVGDRVVEGATLGLVEVMKTFNPVTLGGAGAPKSGVVSAILARDGDEVRANEPLFRIVAE